MDKPGPSLEEVFSPRGIAIVGASPSAPGSLATQMVLALKEMGFPAIYPVNRKYSEQFGIPCYPSLLAIPGVVDHVAVGIPAAQTLALLDECAARGVRSVHFFTAGFSESGVAERGRLEAEMLARARAGGFRIIGPNCIGMYVPKNRVASARGHPIEPGPIAFISQSGGHAINLPFFAKARGLRFSKIVSYGNALDVNESELLDYLTSDPDTEIIAAYIEGVKDGQSFFRALRTAAARKPVVIYKGGMTEAGKRAAFGHTASLTSSVDVFTALCRQVGAMQADDIEELTDILVALRFARPLPGGTGVAVVGAGGGPSVQASDDMERAGLRVPRLPPEALAELRHYLPLDGSIFLNPVDTPNLYSPEAISTALRAVGRVADIHMMLYHLGFHPISRWGLNRVVDTLAETVRALTGAREATGKPVLMALRPPPEPEGMKEFLPAQEAFVLAGLPVFYSLPQAARAMARVIAWRQGRVKAED